MTNGNNKIKFEDLKFPKSTLILFGILSLMFMIIGGLVDHLIFKTSKAKPLVVEATHTICRFHTGITGINCRTAGQVELIR